MQNYTIRVIRTLRYVTTSLPEVSSLFLSYSPPCLWWCRNDAVSYVYLQFPSAADRWFLISYRCQSYRQHQLKCCPQKQGNTWSVLDDVFPRFLLFFFLRHFFLLRAECRLEHHAQTYGDEHVNEGHAIEVATHVGSSKEENPHRGMHHE